MFLFVLAYIYTWLILPAGSACDEYNDISILDSILVSILVDSSYMLFLDVAITTWT